MCMHEMTNAWRFVSATRNTSRFLMEVSSIFHMNMTNEKKKKTTVNMAQSFLKMMTLKTEMKWSLT